MEPAKDWTRGHRYKPSAAFHAFVRDELRYLDFPQACSFYRTVLPQLTSGEIAFLGCNDRFFLLAYLLNRQDVVNPWLFDRMREVEINPDGYLDLWAREHYKAECMDTPIPTPSGWARFGDLDVGDWVFGPDGMPVQIVARTPVFTDADCFEVVFDDGTSSTVSGDHLWTVEQRTRKRIPGTHKAGAGGRQYRETVTLSTREIASRDHTPDNRLAIPVNDPLVMPDALLPIEPYTLGAWLGDGSNDDGRVTCADAEVFQAIRAEGYEVGPNARKQAGCETRTVYGIRPILADLGLLRAKRIPVFYQRASVKQRLELLRGLMDTDGHCNTRGTATFVNKHEPLVDSVYELAAGLGLKPRKYAFEAAHGRYWHVAFQAYQAMNPFRIARKAVRAKAGERPRPRRYIVDVRPVDTVPVRCIQVDRKDGLYLSGRHMVTTHNSTVITFAGIIQEVLCDPELTCCIFSHSREIAAKFLVQIMRELEGNDRLKALYADVLWENPKKEAPIWSVDGGLIVKRYTNPKEGTVEAWGLVDGQPTSKHFSLLVYDDVVTPKSVTNPQQVKKTTESWELSDNLGAGDVRKWHIGTRYSFADTYGVILERKVLKPRIYAATDDGTLNGTPVFMGVKRWEEKKRTQRSTIAAQMLQNPLAGQENMFRAEWLRPWEIRPTTLTIYIMGDPSRGSNTARSDRTAFAVIGIDSQGNKYLLDGYRHRMKLSERWECLKGLWKKWSAARGVQNVSVGYERYGMQSDDEYFQERMEIEDFAFPIEEISWTREGGNSKKDRVERLEPDFRLGRFYLPATVHEPGLGDCYWKVNEAGNHIVTTPARTLTRQMQIMASSGQDYRIAKPIVRRDEDGKLYDLTRALMEEMMFFPFAPKDDLVDACSRIYDMQATPPAVYESQFVAAQEYAPDV